MKRKQLLLSAFLLMLYIVPAILGPSSIASLRENGPNMTKEFSPSYDYEYEADDQSITSFSDTLPDDVLNYPDLFTWSIMTATDGTGEYLRLNDTDEITIDGDIILYFDIDASGTDVFEGIDYYLNVLTAIGWMAVYNYTSDSWETVTEIDDVWKNGTIYSKDYFEYNVGTYRMSINLTDVLSADYLGVSFKGMTLSEYGYAESFADVSDWALYANEGSDAKSSDGDVLSWTCNRNANPDSDYIYTNTPSIPAGSYYFEVRYKMNTTGGPQVGLYAKTGSDFPAGDGLTVKSDLNRTTSWTTYKAYILTTATIESFYFYTSFTTHSNFIFYFDYFRFANSTSMGWQHDGSTTEGVTVENGASISSDGSILTITNDASSQCRFYPDTTTTKTYINPDYYPFIHVQFNTSSIGMDFAFESYDGSYRALQARTTITKQDYYYNVRALSGTAWQYLRFYFYDSDTIAFNFVKAYSIADFTLTQSACETDDYFYCESGSLYSTLDDSVEYITANHDPTLSVTIGEFDMWNISSPNINPNAGTDIEFRATISGAEALEGTDESGGYWAKMGTLTDLRFTIKNTMSISAIKFLSPIPQWNEVNEVQLIFNIPLDEWALNMFLILLGMIMVPASTGYLVYGGKNSFSTDKLLYGLFAFMMGWALIFGGIFS